MQSKIGKVFGSDKKQSWVGCLLLSRLSKEVVTMVVFATLSEAKKIVFASLCNELCYAVEGLVLASLLFYSRWQSSLFADIYLLLTSLLFNAMTLLDPKA